MKGSFYTDVLGKRETGNIINEQIFIHSEKSLIYWAERYKENPRHVINCFLKYESIRMSICLITFWARKNGVLKELKGKDFKEWVGKQNLEEKWKPVMENFLLILWGVNH